MTQKHTLNWPAGIGLLAAVGLLALDWHCWPALLGAAFLALVMELELRRDSHHIEPYHPPDDAELNLLGELVRQRHGDGRSPYGPREQEAVVRLTHRGFAVVLDNELCATDVGRLFWKDVRGARTEEVAGP